MTECDRQHHDQCIVLRRRADWETGAMIITGVQMPQEAHALARIVEDARNGLEAPVITVEGDLIRFTLANGTWIYRIGERFTVNGEDSYLLRWVD